MRRVVLVSRCILAMGFDFYLPLSLVEENMRRASLRDAATEQRFYVRRSAMDPFAGAAGVPAVDPADVVEMSADEFLSGRTGGFPGIVPAVLGYLDSLGCDALTKGRLLPYLSLIQKRASGELPTTAAWLRRQVVEHADYAGDGRIGARTADDLLRLCEDVGMGRVARPDLMGDVFVRALECDDPYDLPADAQLHPRADCGAVASYRPRSFCEGDAALSVLCGSGPQPDTYLDSAF